jgi:hypothetical protein
VGGTVDEIEGLLRDLSLGNRPPTEPARARLTELLDLWNELTCAGCGSGSCPFRRRTAPWIEHEGYVNLYEVVVRLADIQGPIDRVPPRDGLDAFDATWARRPGHYNP